MACPLKFGIAKKRLKSGAISDNFRLWSPISPERIYISKIEKVVHQLQPLLRWAIKSWWTLVHKQNSYWRAYWPTQVDIVRETIFRPLRGRVMCPQIFIRARDFTKLANAHPNWDGVPPKWWKFKIWLKILRVRPYNFGAGGNILTKLCQATLWTLVHKRKSYSAHIGPPELLVYCKLTQVHTPRGSFLSRSPAAIAAIGISTT